MVENTIETLRAALAARHASIRAEMAEERAALGTTDTWSEGTLNGLALAMTILDEQFPATEEPFDLLDEATWAERELEN